MRNINSFPSLAKKAPPYQAESLPADKKDKAYLRTRFQRDLKQNPACFQLQVQLHDGKEDADSATPLDRATVAWDEVKFRRRLSAF